MKLNVSVLGRDVAVLESVGDFKSVLTYHPAIAPSDFVSLTMPVRTESYLWDDALHPIFQMNLPEGYLLQVLQEKFGPHIGGSPTALLAVVGRNMVGRIQVAAPGAVLSQPPRPIELGALLKGDNSELAFAQLVREHASSGVSGVVPKFLDEATEKIKPGKATILTHRHIIKGSSSRLPFVSLNEHLCLQVSSKILPTATTEVSDDGQVLVIDRFDVDALGRPNRGMEDFCSLLGMKPAAKYDTTWERIARVIRDHVPSEARAAALRTLAQTLLLTYALRNSDCHSKNLALLYTSRADVFPAPVYDMLTTTVYDGYQHSPPGIAFLGKKTWTPGKNLERFIVSTLGVEVKDQRECVEKISDAIAQTAPRVRQAMADHPGFEEIGKRMLLAWKEGVGGLRDQKTFALGAWKSGPAFEGLAGRRRPRPPSTASVGRSELLARKVNRRRRRQS